MFRAHAPGRQMILTTYGRSSGLLRRSDREKAAQPVLPGLERAVLRHRGLQPRLQVLPELGHLEVARLRSARRPGQSRDDRKSSGRPRLQEHCLHLQRSGDFRRVRDGRRRRLPRGRRQDRGGDRGLHARPAAARVLRQDGRRQRRPEGLHRGFLLQAHRRSPPARARHARLSQARDRRLVRDHDAADSPARTTATRRSTPSAAGSRESSGRTCRCTSPPSIRTGR